MNRPAYYPLELDQVTDELEHAVLEAISSHRGAMNALRRETLVRNLRMQEIQVTDRKIRNAIHSLRRQGFLICSSCGANSGYYMAMNHEEYEQFRLIEYAGKIADMSETMRLMDAQADRQFIKSTTQPRLL
jgi:hypothetical protein